MRRLWSAISLLTFACVCAGGVTFSAWASNGQPYRLIVPYPPGGSADVMARIIAAEFSERTGKNMIVENKPGAGAIIGARYVANEKPDGKTLLFGTVSSQVMTPALNVNAPYDAIRDFVPVSFVASLPFLLISNGKTEIQNMDDLRAIVKKNGRPLTYSSAGVGTSNHLAGLFFEREVGVKLEHVPYRGSSPALVALMSGEVDLMFDLILTTLPHIETKKVQPIAISTPQRSRFAPEVPSLHELGLGKFDVTAWFGIFAPAETPKHVVASLAEDFSGVLRSPHVEKRFLDLGIEPRSMELAEFDAFIRAEDKRWRTLITDAGISVDQ